MFSNIIKSTSASVGNLLVDNNYDKNYKVFKNIKFLNLWIAVFTSICILFITKPFITIWLGNDYLLSDFVLISLVICYFQRSMRNTYIVFKDSAGIWIEDRYITMLKPIINIVSSIILLKSNFSGPFSTIPPKIINYLLHQFPDVDMQVVWLLFL